MNSPWMGADIADYDTLASKLRDSMDPRPTLCADCFGSDRFQHPHARFLRIDTNGTHTVVQREVGIAEETQLTMDDFPVVRPSWQGKRCKCCDRSELEFDEDDVPAGPPVAYPGCIKRHGLPVRDDKGSLPEEEGAIDSEEYYCAECSLGFLGAGHRDRYCGNLQPWSFCRVCAQESQTESFAMEFQAAAKSIDDCGDHWEQVSVQVFDRINAALATSVSPVEAAAAIPGGTRAGIQLLQTALKELHPQPWLHAEIDKLTSKW